MLCNTHEKIISQGNVTRAFEKEMEWILTPMTTLAWFLNKLLYKCDFSLLQPLRSGVGGSLTVTVICSLKPLWSGMREVVPARTSPTLHSLSPFPYHCAVIILFKSVLLHQLSWLAHLEVLLYLQGISAVLWTTETIQWKRHISVWSHYKISIVQEINQTGQCDLHSYRLAVALKSTGLGYIQYLDVWIVGLSASLIFFHLDLIFVHL